jgi:hypothetical protein
VRERSLRAVLLCSFVQRVESDCGVAAGRDRRDGLAQLGAELRVFPGKL